MDAEDASPRRPGTLPPGACDACVQLIGPLAAFPVDTDDPPMEATLAQLHRRLAVLGLARAVLVQPDCYGKDNACMLQALARHRNILRGVATVRADSTDEELERLAHTGVRGLRVTEADPAALETLAARVEPLGWHLELGLGPAALRRLAPLLGDLPVEVVIDRMGSPSVLDGPGAAGFKALLRLVRGGRCWVKLSDADGISAAGPPWHDTLPFAQALIEADPTRVVWGSGWPHPVARGRPPDPMQLLDLLDAWARDARLRRLILVDNPARLYRFGE